MFWSINQYPEMRGRSSADRADILKSALSEHGRAFRWRLLIAFAVVVPGIVWADTRHFARVPLTDWRLWAVAIAGALAIYVYLLWEINGPIHAAVKKVAAARAGDAGISRGISRGSSRSGRRSRR